ncbi:MAG: hypothetical protein JKY81_01430 [Colwellia sp.]|nr:hypothetical protein [Colwellia sp.]
MELDQLKSNWQQQFVKKSQDEQSDLEKHMRAIEDKMAALDRNVKSRTLYGTITFILMLVSIIAFSYFQYLLSNSLMLVFGYTVWVVSIAVSLIRLFVVKRRHNINDNMLTIKESLQYKLSKVESEIQFYLSIVWKILAPMSIGFVLILVGKNASLLVAASQMILFILACYFSYRYNKYYVTKNLTPIKEDIVANLNALSKKD